MQNTRLISYSVQHDLERLFDELKGALLERQPPAPVDFLIGCLATVQQKKREVSKEPLQYSTLFNEYAAQSFQVNSVAGAQRNFPLKSGSASGPSRKRQRSEEDHYMNNRTPPYTDLSTSQSNEDIRNQWHPSFANSSSPPRQNLSERFFQHQYSRKGRRNSVSAESIEPSEACNTIIKSSPKSDIAKRQIEEATQNNLLFRNLDKEIKAQVLDAMTERRVTKGETIIKQGDEGDNFYVVTHGMFEILVNGRKVVNVADGGSFGELALMYNAPRAATVNAITDGILWAVDRKTFLSTITIQMYRKRKTYEDFLRSVTILQYLQPSEITKLADALEPIKYQNNDTIVHQGDLGEYFYIIEQGFVNVWKSDGHGTNQRLPGLSTGQYFGELALINDKPRSATVVANGPVNVVALKRDAFDRLLGPVGAVMDTIRRNAENYQTVDLDMPSSPQQQPSPASPVPERSGIFDNTSAFSQHGRDDSMAVDDTSINSTAIRNNVATKKSGYSGAGGVDVL